MVGACYQACIYFRFAGLGPLPFGFVVFVPAGDDEVERAAICARIAATACISNTPIGIG